MLKRNSGNISSWAFLVGCEIEEGGTTSPEQVALRLAEGLTFMEGVGAVEVENLGKIDVYAEDKE